MREIGASEVGAEFLAFFDAAVNAKPEITILLAIPWRPKVVWAYSIVGLT